MKDKYSRQLIENLLITGLEIGILAFGLHVGSELYRKNTRPIIPPVDSKNVSTYFIASRGSEEISDLMYSGFNNSSKPRL